MVYDQICRQLFFQPCIKLTAVIENFCPM